MRHHKIRYNNAHKQAQSPFFSLPNEIRLLIYNFMIPSELDVYQFNASDPGNQGYTSQWVLFWRGRDEFAEKVAGYLDSTRTVCKRMNTEAGHEFFNRVHFQLHIGCYKQSNPLQYEQLLYPHVQHLELRLGDRGPDERIRKEIKSAAERFVNLKTLRIQFLDSPMSTVSSEDRGRKRLKKSVYDYLYRQGGTHDLLYALGAFKVSTTVTLTYYPDFLLEPLSELGVERTLCEISRAGGVTKEIGEEERESVTYSASAIVPTVPTGRRGS
ncbi:hypothetical protein NA57DRAFT_72364 [Rhizodiscina lignyota]|uniref:Uncharacterized protein n=1 Tax=Rhizodiscina lignyota TaxID=1504668 RepID=A0A9P4MFB4_9PEZI|nr:hypothetical protein NA57DRAFT_72364 [Rhizodiscina lignyota]